MKYLNLGCGAVKLPGFCNIDLQPGADLTLDVTKGLPFDSGSVDGVYSEHFIGHLQQRQILQVLRECRRVLRSGGRCRIATPDLDVLVAEVYENRWRQPWLDKYGYAWVSNRAEYLNVSMRDWGHQYLVNEEELVRLGRMAGFDRFARCALGQSDDPALRGLETRSESSLIIEFEKQSTCPRPESKVSVVIPAYRATFFESCLRSALEQTRPAFEVLVGDDSGGSEIEGICQRYANQGFPVFYFRNDVPLGEVENFTALIRRARGDFIKPLHDDDVLLPQAIERLLDAWRADPDVRLAVGTRSFIDAGGQSVADAQRLLGQRDAVVLGSAVAAWMLEHGVNLVGEPTCMLFRREDALALEEPNVMSLFGRTCYGAGDVCLALQLLSRGNLAYVATPLMQVRHHEGQTQVQPGHRETGFATWRYLQQQGYRLGLTDARGRADIPEAGAVVFSYLDGVAPAPTDADPSAVRVTVGLIVYNQEHTVAEAIDSILAQNWPIERLVICDDASTDGTWNKIEEALARWEDGRGCAREIVKLRNPSNLGYLANFHQAVRTAGGDLFVYHAGDDVSMPGRIERLVKAYVDAGRPRFALIHSNVYVDAVRAETIWRPPVLRLNQARDIWLSTALHIGATEAFTPSLLTAIGDIVHKTYDDLVLGARAAALGCLIHVDEPLLLYRSGGITSGHRVMGERDLDERHVRETLLQRWRDAHAMGVADAQTWLGQRLLELGVSLPEPPPKLSIGIDGGQSMPMAITSSAAVAPWSMPGAAGAHEGASASRLLVIAEATEFDWDWATRLARFFMAQRAGSNLQIHCWQRGQPQPDFRDFHWIWICGVPVIAHGTEWLEAIEQRRSPVVWEVPRWPQPAGAPTGTDALVAMGAQRLLNACSVAIAPTAAMAEWLQRQGVVATVVMSDALPASWWPQLVQGLPPPRDAVAAPRVGVRGAGFSNREWALVEDVLWTLAHRCPGVQMHVWGMPPDTVRQIPGVVVSSDAVPDAKWPARLALQPIDIALWPVLEGRQYSVGGDRLWLEWVAAGAWVVASEHAPLSEDAVTHGLVARVPNQPGAWCDAILEGWKDSARRIDAVQRAREYARQRCLDRQWQSDLQRLNALLPPALRVQWRAGDGMLEPLAPGDAAWVYPTNDYRRWCAERALREVDADVLAERVVGWGVEPIVLFVTLVGTSDEIHQLAVTAASLGAQLYSGWRWLIVSDLPCPDPSFEHTPALAWCQIDTLDDATAVVAAVAQAHRHWGCDWLCWLLPGAYVHAHASIEVLDAAHRDHRVRIVFHDHDVWDETEPLGESTIDEDWLAQRRREPAFKPAVDRLWLLQSDYAGPTVWWRVGQETLPLKAVPGAWWYEVVLAGVWQDRHAVRHVPDVLMTLPKQALQTVHKEAVVARRAVAEMVCRQHLGEGVVRVEPSPFAGVLRLEAGLQRASMSVVLVLQDVHFQNRSAIEALEGQDLGEDEAEFIVVAHQVSDPDTRDWLQMVQQSSRWRVIEDDEPYDLARLYDRGARLAQHEVCVFLHADVVAVDQRMLSRLVRVLALPGVDVAAPLLLKPETAAVDCAGWAPGGIERWQLAHALGEPYTLWDAGPMDMLRVVRAVPAVDPVAFAVRRATWRALIDAQPPLETPQALGVALGMWAVGNDKVAVVSPYARAAHQRDASANRLYPPPDVRLQQQLTQLRSMRQAWMHWGRGWADAPAWPHALNLRGQGWSLDQTAPIRWPLEQPGRHRTLGYSLSGGSGEYRVKSPLRTLAQSGLQYTEVIDRNARLLTPAELMRLQPDTVLLHQWIGPDTAQALQDWRAVAPRTRLVLGMDDRNDAVPEKSNLYGVHRRNHPDARAKLRRVIAGTDAVIVSTEPLRAMLEELGLRQHPVYVIPNALDRARWGHLQPPRRGRQRARVGWIGAMQHRGDLELLLPVIEATRHTVDWIFMGMVLPEIESQVKEVHRWVPYDRYPQAIAALDLDLAVAPLAYNIFNECKSNLRLLEYGAAGYPVIATDITPYRENDPPIVRLPNDPGQWIEAIHELVRDRSGLQVRGQRLKEWVWSHFDLERHVPAWHAALTGQTVATV